MSVTSGFFNSLNGDRRYTAEQMSSLFDGLIRDGVFATVGTAFAVTAGTGNEVTIGVGRAWFNHTWVYNDALLPMTLTNAETILDRIDAIVIEINRTEAIRSGSIRILVGVPSGSPQRPELTDVDNVYQYPLAYIYRTAGSTTITQADITNMIGTSACPYVTGILQTVNADNLLAQWDSEFNIWFDEIQGAFEEDPVAGLANRIIALEGKLDTLAREGAVYADLEDSDGNKILDSYGSTIQGSTAFAYRGSGGPHNSVSNDDLLVALDNLSDRLNAYMSSNNGAVNALSQNITQVNNTLTASINSVNTNLSSRIDSLFKVGDTINSVRSTPPDGNWRLCNGESFNRTTYPTLSQLLGPVPRGPWNRCDLSQIQSNNYFLYTIYGYMCVGEYYIAGALLKTVNQNQYCTGIAYATNPAGPWTITPLDSTSYSSSNIQIVDGVKWGNYYVLVATQRATNAERILLYYTANVSSGSWITVEVLNDTSANFHNAFIAVSPNGNQGMIAVGAAGSPSRVEIFTASSPTGGFSRITKTSPSGVAYFIQAFEYLNGYFVLLGGYSGKLYSMGTSFSGVSGANFVQVTGRSGFNTNGGGKIQLAYVNGKYAFSTLGNMYLTADIVNPSWTYFGIPNEIYEIKNDNSIGPLVLDGVNVILSDYTPNNSASSGRRFLVIYTNDINDPFKYLYYVAELDTAYGFNNVKFFKGSNSVVMGFTTERQLYYAYDSQTLLPEIAIDGELYTYIKVT